MSSASADRPPIPYGRQSIDDSDVAAVIGVLRGDWLTTGPAVEQFERDLAGWTGGVPTVAVTSGTAALHVAYAAAGVGPGSDIVTTPITFAATAATAALLGAHVVFADVEPDTANLDPAAAEAALTPRTRAICAVDYAGHPADLTRLVALAKQAEIAFVEDAAHSIGSHWQGQPVGSFADLTTFSFFPTKNLTTAEGGAVAVRDPAALERARRFRSHGLVRDPGEQRMPEEGPWHQEVHSLGLNYRLPDVLCALGSSQLRRLGEFRSRRTQIVDRYDAGLGDLVEVRLPARRDGAGPMWHLYPLRVREGRRRALYAHLHSHGVAVQVNFVPVYWHPVFADLGYRRGLCPNAEAFYAEELSLPLYVDLSDSAVDRVISCVRDFFGG